MTAHLHALPLSAETPNQGEAVAPTSGYLERVEAVAVLVVDDDPETARALQRSLESEENTVKLAASGKDALVALKHSTFDVVVSDIAMPAMDGFSLFEEIKGINPTIPIILLTGDPSVLGAARALEAGAYRYVTKPPNPKDLRGIVQKAARLARQKRSEGEESQPCPPHSTHAKKENQNRDRVQSSLSRSFDHCLQKMWMAYQPIFDCSNDCIIGYEALMRSRIGELPHPNAILAAAEQLGRLNEMARTVRSLCPQTMKSAEPFLNFFINIHPQDLSNDEIFSQDSPLIKYAHRIVFEITERASLVDVSNIAERVSLLRKLGYRIAIDNLGAGYAGLTRLALLEPEWVKLDMSLVRDIHLNRTKKKVVQSIIVLSKEMGINVIGEGVESVNEADALSDLGCAYLQGYYFGRPEAPLVEVQE